MGRIIKVLLIVLIISISTATGVLIHEVRELKKTVQNQQEVLGIYYNIIQSQKFPYGLISTHYPGT